LFSYGLTSSAASTQRSDSVSDRDAGLISTDAKDLKVSLRISQRSQTTAEEPRETERGQKRERRREGETQRMASEETGGKKLRWLAHTLYCRCFRKKDGERKDGENKPNSFLTVLAKNKRRKLQRTQDRISNISTQEFKLEVGLNRLLWLSLPHKTWLK